MDKILKIEITDYCNARCVFCNYNKTNTHMALSDIVSIVNKCPEILRVEPQHLGEPLMHPDFLDIIRFLKNKGKKIAFHTNASLLKGDLAEGIAEVAPELIRFSVESDNKEDYESLRIGLNWEEVLGNIGRFQAIKKDTTHTQVVMLRTPENADRIDKIGRFWAGIVNSVTTAQELPHGRNLKGRLRAKPLKCWKIESMLTIKVNGDIVICCEDWNSEYVIGNVKEGIKNAINSEKAKDLTDQLSKGKPLSICETCSVFWEGVQ